MPPTHEQKMPPPEYMDLTDLAVLWPRSSPGDSYGVPTVGSPVDVPVRWEWTHREVVDAQGNTVSIDAQAALAQDVQIGSRMWYAPDPSTSALAQWLGTGSAGDESGVMTVITVRRARDSRGREVRCEVGLSFFRDDAGE